MAYENNHFVPQLILRRYGDRINRYNLKNDEYFVNGNIRNCFSCKNLYPKELEIKLCDVESRFANLLNNKILPAKDELILYRDEISLIKKFLLLQTFRVPEALVEQEGSKGNPDFCEKMYGFKEKVIPNETYKEYVFRTMNLIIDCKDFNELLEREDKTYLAAKWALLYQACYLTIWDSEKSGEDFIITDRGMTCEHEKTRFAFERYGFKEELIKEGYLFSKMFDQSLNSDQKAMYFMHSNLCRHVYANYYMFSISETRMIGMINPWFRLHYDENKIKIAQGVPDVFPCKLSREAIEPNKNRYINVKDANSTPFMSTSDYDSKDEYIYKIKDLKLEEVYLINCLMLDRVAEVVGFVNTNKVIKSINVYSKLKSHINNYDGLKSKLIDLGYNFSNSEKYQKIADDITRIEFSEEERKYINLMFNLKNNMKDDKM